MTEFDHYFEAWHWTCGTAFCQVVHWCTRKYDINCNKYELCVLSPKEKLMGFDFKRYHGKSFWYVSGNRHTTLWIHRFALVGSKEKMISRWCTKEFVWTRKSSATNCSLMFTEENEVCFFSWIIRCWRENTFGGRLKECFFRFSSVYCCPPSN